MNRKLLLFLEGNVINFMIYEILLWFKFYIYSFGFKKLLVYYVF